MYMYMYIYIYKYLCVYVYVYLKHHDEVERQIFWQSKGLQSVHAVYLNIYAYIEINAYVYTNV